LAQARRNEERWCLPELLRIKGTLLSLEGNPGSTIAAENHFLESLDWARRQGALSWELRAAVSLARLRQGKSCASEARDLLAPSYARFTEGFETADLKTAKQLLNELA
jgi:predicted ATPase